MKELIERFYNSIRRGDEPPIPYREIILTARIMDEIFAQIYPNRVGQKGDRREGLEIIPNATAFDVPLSVVSQRP